MERVFISLAALALIGVVLALTEWRRKRVFLAHDMNLINDPQTEADRQRSRTVDEMAGRAIARRRRWTAKSTSTM